MHLNTITDVPGVAVGHAHDVAVVTGVTVLFAPGCVAAGVDARGGAPGTRETDALAPENLVGRLDAVVLSGGSVFGLAAADAVAAALSARGIGLRLAERGPAIPIVPAAVLHDLGNGGDKAWGEAPPYAALGRAALAAAGADRGVGRIGAGHGARAGLEWGGLGTASADLGDGVIVGAIVAINPVGTVRLSDGCFLAWPWEVAGEFGGQRPGADACAADPLAATRLGGLAAAARSATVIAAVATSASLTPAQCRRVAIMAHDGIARAVTPSHTPYDGDVVFALAMGKGPAAATHLVARIGDAAAVCLARAIARGVWGCEPGSGVVAEGQRPGGDTRHASGAAGDG